MRLRHVGVVAFVLVALQAAGQEGLPGPLLQELKAASVYVKVAEDKESWSGSGFLFRKEGGTGFIATNAHVVDGDRARQKITVVFNSGTPQESQVPAQIRAIDHDRDVAVLEVKSAALPKPIETRSRRTLKETMIVYTIGFPFGGDLAVGAKNPEVTFGRSSISSLRLDDQGELAAVQLDGEVNPGNSGGPAVDESGDLVGIVTSRIRKTQIAFAVPSRHLESLVQGRAGDITGEVSEVTRTSAKLRVRVALDDPLKRLRGVSVAWAALDPDNDRKLEWKPQPAVPNMKHQALRIDGDDAWGDVTISSGGKEVLMVVLQTVVTRGDGEVAWGFPEVGVLNFLETITPNAEVLLWQDVRPGLTVVENANGKARCSLSLDLLIPRKVRSVTMIVKRSLLSPRLPPAGRNGIRGRLQGRVDEYPLVVSESRASGEATVSADPGGGPVTLVLQGMVELEDRRRIYTTPVVQVVPFARPGVARAVTPDDWIVLAKSKNRDAGRSAGIAPVAEETDWAGPVQVVQDASVRKIAIAGKDFLPLALWSADGRSAYLVERSGVIRMMSVPDLKQTRRLSIGRPCQAAHLTLEGLMVHVSKPGEIWILDPSTLEFRRKITLDGVTSLAGSPGSSKAFAVAQEKLYVVDLREGRVLKVHVARDFTTKNLDKPKKAPGTVPLWNWGSVHLSPDGTTLLTADRTLNRFRVTEADLAWEEAGPGRESKGEPCLSADGKYFALYEPMPGSMEKKQRIGIYAVKDLAGPLLTLPTGTPNPKHAFAFDKEAGKLYGAEYGKQIVVYTPKGERARQYEIASDLSVEFMIAHPTGNRVLLLTGPAGYWVEFGK